MIETLADKIDIKTSRDAQHQISSKSIEINTLIWSRNGGIYFPGSIWFSDSRFGKSTDRRKLDRHIGNEIGPKSACQNEYKVTGYNGAIFFRSRFFRF